MTSAASAPATTPSSTGLDGRYRAPEGGASGNAGCGTTRFGYPIIVTNGNASLQTSTMGAFEGKVGADGSLNIEKGRGVLRGQFSGNEFNGYLTQNSCSFTLNYKKR